MKKYIITTTVTSARGNQVWEVKAKSKEDALKRFKSGEGDIVAEELEVQDFTVSLDDIEEYNS